MKLVFLLVFTIGVLGAQASERPCWINEIDEQTSAPFQSEKEFLKVKKSWRAAKPKSPTIWALFKALRVIHQEEKETATLPTDGAKHCYLGCRITQSTGRKAAVYAGWSKEWRDLRDCRLDTHFEVRDFEETVYGASIAKNIEEKEGCWEACRARFH